MKRKVTPGVLSLLDVEGTAARDKGAEIKVGVERGGVRTDPSQRHRESPRLSWISRGPSLLMVYDGSCRKMT